MKSKIFGIMGVVGLLFAGCSSEDDILSSFHNDPDAVHITAEVGKASADGFTRSNPLGATAEEQQKFNDGDMISVKADGQEAVTYKLVGSEWQPQGGKFLKWESKSMNFTAYYPATYNGGTITQPTEYTSEKSLAEADFMSYTDSQSNTNGNTLTLTMNRKMARVVVDVVKFNDQYAQNTTVNSVTIKGVKAYNHEGKFYALMVPCDEDKNANFLSLKVGESNTETLKGIPALEAGKSYTYQLTVGKNKVVVSGITVANWTTGEITGGKAELYVPYVTFTAEGAQKFKMTTTGGYDLSDKFQYSVNEGKWENVVKDKPVPFGGDKGNLRLRGTNPYGTAPARDAYSTITFIEPSVKVACTGDIRTLLDWRNYATVATGQARFYNLFYDCKVLTSAPALPATNLANYCYESMFSGCTSLESAPKMSAERLAQDCCEYMFRNCTSLTSAPALPAKELAYGCYAGMFQRCTSLTSAPKLPATKLEDQCYVYMFAGCSNLSTVTMLALGSEITSNSARVEGWLYKAGTETTSRTLKIQDKAAYEALKANINYLPAQWQKDTAGTTVQNASGNAIE